MADLASAAFVVSARSEFCAGKNANDKTKRFKKRRVMLRSNCATKTGM
jgi:hypothetical protein